MLELIILFNIEVIFFFYFFFIFFLFLKNLYKNIKASIVYYKIKFCLIFLGLLYLHIYINPIICWSFFDFLIFYDYFSYLSLLIYLIFFFFFLFILIKIQIDYFYYFETFFILNCTFFCITILFKVYDLLLLFIVFETFSLCLYILASLNYTSIKIAEAGVKYYILAVVSSLFLLYGISLLYLIFGSFNILKIKIFIFFNSENLNFIILFSLSLILCAFFFKIGLAPFHIWVVEIYYGISLIAFFFFSIFSKYVFFIIFFRMVLWIIIYYIDYYLYIFLFIGILSIFIGTFGGLIYRDLRKILAYSSIAHNGFILLALINLSFYSIYIFYIYLIVYSMLMFFFFIIFFIFKRFNILFSDIDDLIMIRSSSIFIIMLLLSLFFSMAGIPPFMGFFIKYLVCSTLFNNNINFFVFLLLILLLNLVSIYIYLRFVVYMFFSKIYFKFFKFKNLLSLICILIFLFFFNLVFIIFVDFFYNYFYLIIIYNFICFI
jgi:NADH-quinone oxidoreductase subunit N